MHAPGRERFTFYYLNAHLLEGDLRDPSSQVWVGATGGKYELTDGSGVLAYQGSWNAKVMVEGNFSARVVKGITILRFQTVLQRLAAPDEGDTIKTGGLLFGPGEGTIQPGIMLTK